MTTPEPDTPDTTPTYLQEGDMPQAGDVYDPAKGVPGYIFLKSMETREIRDSTKSYGNPPENVWRQYLRDRVPDEDEYIAPGTYFWAYFEHPTWEGINRAIGKYYGYDLGVYDDPVNQVPDTREWLTHIATFAHEIDTLFSEHTSPCECRTTST